MAVSLHAQKKAEFSRSILIRLQSSLSLISVRPAPGSPDGGRHARGAPAVARQALSPLVHDRNRSMGSHAGSVALSPPARSLWDRIYPNATPVRLQQLPACARGMRVFVYNLSDDYHARLLAKAEQHRGSANCDFARSPCEEKTRSVAKKRDAWDYSNVRQYSAEVPLLAKFLLMPQAASADEADLFIVPWLASTEMAVASGGRMLWWPGNKFFTKRLERLLPQLTHFERAPRRHLFLSSRDESYSITALRKLSDLTGAMLAHYGPKSPRSTEIVLAPNSAGFEAPLVPLPPARNFLFAMMDPTLNKQREAVSEALSELNATAAPLGIRKPVRYYRIGDHRTIPLTPVHAAKMMRESLLCPIVQGDFPYQHRFFDALASGCVPLMFEYEGGVGGRNCTVLSWDPQTRDRKTHRTMFAKDGACFACAENALPFSSTVDWPSVVATIPGASLDMAGTTLRARSKRRRHIARAIAALDRRALYEKRRRLESVRHRFFHECGVQPRMNATAVPPEV